MSEITATRKTLRRAIALELGMPFFRRFAAGESYTDTGSTVEKIVDSSLSQRDNFWNNGWYYGVVTGETSLVRSFNSAGNLFYLETPLASTPADTGDLYEIHHLWNAIEIHEAVNRAIRAAGRIWTETVVDSTLIIEENQLEYTISGLTKTPFIVNKVFVENPGTVLRGVATAGAAATITLESVPSDIDTGWKIAIYGETGSGQIRNYVSNAGNVVTVAAWTTQPASGSKYVLWDAAAENYDWQPLHQVYTDSIEFPDVLRLRSNWSQYYGMRMKIEYLALPSALTTDSDTTVIPQEYIVNQAIATLHGQKLNDTKADRDLHFAENQRYAGLADAFIARYAPHLPASHIPSIGVPYSSPEIDPLNWREW